jgi:hypothetical protein
MADWTNKKNTYLHIYKSHFRLSGFFISSQFTEYKPALPQKGSCSSSSVLLALLTKQKRVNIYLNVKIIKKTIDPIFDHSNGYGITLIPIILRLAFPTM